MLTGIENIVSNLEMSFENIIVLILFFGGLIFYSKNFKLGLVMSFLKDGVVFMWFYQAGLNFTVPVILFFIDLVLLCLSLYFVSQSTQTGQII